MQAFFEQLLANGFSAVPIGPRSADPNGPRGKEPARLFRNNRGEPDWHYMKGWRVFCDRQPHPRAFSLDLQDPECGLGIACGYRNLVAIDIDRDDLIEPILAKLPTLMVAKRGRKGLTIFMRGEKLFKKRNYRTASKEGLLDFCAHGAQTVIPPSIHPDTGRPYEWTTARTLFNTSIDQLPTLTQSHWDAIEAVLKTFGWQDKPKPQPSPAVVPVRSSWHSDVADHFAFIDEISSAALANIPAWVDVLNLPKGHWRGNVYRGVAPWRTSGSGRDEAARGTNLSIAPGGIVDFGSGETFTPVGVVIKARRLSRDEATDLLCDRLGIKQPAPIVLRNGSKDARKPLPEARRAIASAIADFFDAVPAANAARRCYDNERTLACMGEGRFPLWVPIMPISVLKVETGVGKTAALVEALKENGGRIAVAVPTHALAEQTAADLRAQGIEAEVYRGFERRDPLSPGHAMCRNLPAYKAARALGVSIRSTICERRVDGVLRRCPLADECGTERQRKLSARVWLFPAAMLTLPRPDFIPEFDALVIDEGFIDNCIADPVTLNLADLVGTVEGSCYSPAERAALQRGRQLLLEACLESERQGGWLLRSALNGYRDRYGVLVRDRGHSIDGDHAGYLALLERRRIDDSDLTPGMTPVAMQNAAKKRGAANKRAMALADLWNEIELFRLEDHDCSGRIRIDGSEITLTRLTPVHRDWHIPTLALDATPPPDTRLIDMAFGAPDGSAQITADVLAQWPKHITVRQYLGASVSKNKLGLRPGQKLAKKNVRDIVRHVQMRAAEAAPDRIGLIAEKPLLDVIRPDLPANVDVAHFGALAGLNDMQTVAGLIVIGRNMPWHSAVGHEAGVWLGHPVVSTGFEMVRAKIGGRTVAVDRHRNRTVDALRWLITEGGLLQAVGRLRPHRRAAPCFLEIINDVALDLPGLVAADWAKPGPLADMMAAGLLLENRRDAAAMFGFSDRASMEGAEAVRRLESFSYIGIPHREMTPTSPPTRPGGGREPNEQNNLPTGLKARNFTYRKRGPGQKLNRGAVLPWVLKGGSAAVRPCLEAGFGLPLAEFQLDRARAIDTAFGRSIFANAARLIEEIASEEDDAAATVERAVD